MNLRKIFLYPLVFCIKKTRQNYLYDTLYMIERERERVKEIKNERGRMRDQMRENERIIKLERYKHE